LQFCRAQALRCCSACLSFAVLNERAAFSSAASCAAVGGVVEPGLYPDLWSACRKPENAVENVWKSLRMSDGAACASACNSLDSVWSAEARFPDDDAETALATFAASPARSWQFFALAKLGAEPELTETDTDLIVAVVECVAPGALELLPPPQPAAAATSPARTMATAIRVGLDLISPSILDLWQAGA
jgi:hypothetical protein